MSKKDKQVNYGNEYNMPDKGNKNASSSKAKSKNMDKLYKKQKKNKEEDDAMAKVIERPCTPAESLEQSLKEMKLMREGKLHKKTWKDFLKELKDDDDGEE